MLVVGAAMALDFSRLLRPTMRLFGSTIVYMPAGGAALSLTGIFDRQHAEVLGEDGAAMNIRSVTLDISLADFTAAGVTPAQNDRVTVDGATWRVIDVRPDAIGGARLVLGSRA